MEESNALAIASINATILAISIGALGIVVSILGDKKLSVLQDIIEKHRSIQLSFASDRRVPLLYDIRDSKFRTDGVDARRKMIASVIQAATGEELCPASSCPQPAQLGERIVTGLAALVTHYPFSNVPIPNFLLDGSFEMPSTPELSGKYYRDWWKHITRDLSQLRNIESYREELLQWVRAYQVERGNPAVITREQQEMKRLKDEVLELDEAIKVLPESDDKRRELLLKKGQRLRTIKDYESSSSTNHEEIVKTILKTLEQARQEIEQVMKQSNLLKHYDEMLSPGLGIFILASLVLTCFFGIVFPMTHKFHGQCNAYWCPYILYVGIPMCGHFLTGMCAWAIISKSIK